MQSDGRDELEPMEGGTNQNQFANAEIRSPGIPRSHECDMGRLDFLFRERLGGGENVGEGFLQPPLGHSDVVRCHAGPTMGREAIDPAGGQCIMQLGVDEAFDGPAKRFGLITYHGNSPYAARAWYVCPGKRKPKWQNKCQNGIRFPRRPR